MKAAILALALALIVLALALYIVATEAHAHYDGPGAWINEGAYRNPFNWRELCCGENDCFVVKGVHRVSLPAPGYRLPDGEFVPQAEAQVSRDGQFWRCRRSDWTRRCFFAPPETN